MVLFITILYLVFSACLFAGGIRLLSESNVLGIINIFLSVLTFWVARSGIKILDKEHECGREFKGDQESN